MVIGLQREHRQARSGEYHVKHAVGLPVTEGTEKPSGAFMRGLWAGKLWEPEKNSAKSEGRENELIDNYRREVKVPGKDFLEAAQGCTLRKTGSRRGVGNMGIFSNTE